MTTFDRLKTPPDDRGLRRFGATLLVLWGVLAAALAFAFDAHGPATTAVAIGLVFLLAGFFPPAGRIAWKAWMGLGLAIGLVTGPIVLAIVFFGVVTPIGLAGRLLRRDPLRRRLDPSATTYWTDYRQPRDPGRYLKPY